MGEVAVCHEPQGKLSSSRWGDPSGWGEAAPHAGTSEPCPDSPCAHQRELAQLLPHLWSPILLYVSLLPHHCRAMLSPQNKSVSMETIQ